MQLNPLVLLAIFLTTFTLSCSGKKGEEKGSAPTQAVPGVVPVVPLPVVVVTTPTTSPVISNASTQSLAGTCTSGATVSISGSATQTAPCTNGTFSATLSSATDGTFSYSITQSSDSSNASPAVVKQWIRDTTAPSVIVLTTPSTNPWSSNLNTVTMSGSCESGATVSVSGAITQSVACSASSFTLTDTRTIDGSFNYSLIQTDPAGNASLALAFIWNRDTVAPAPVIITSPAANPYSSSETTFNLSGTCETGSLVTLSGAQSATVGCLSNSFLFSISKSTDGTYNYSLHQTDPAGNNSSSVSFEWTRAASIPATPVITSHISPFVSNQNNLTLVGTCTSGLTVEISGDATNSATCVANAFSFTLSQTTDGTANYQVVQKNVALISSAAASFSWTRDTVAPATPTITSPATLPHLSNLNSVTISGACEDGASVQISGDTTSSALCSAGSYSFTVNKSSDGSFTFNISQTDPAGNSSASASMVWTRDATAPLAPTITNHATPYLSNSSSLTLAGACETDATVNLSGDATASAVCVASAYSMTISKTSDGTYNFLVSQTDGTGNTSPNTSFAWTRDVTAPSPLTIVAPSTSPYSSSNSSLTISGTCETGASIALSGDSSGSTTCLAGVFSTTVNKSSDGTYNFTLNQTDAAGNVSANTTQQWIRDTAIPPTPVITLPATSPHTSSSGTLNIAGTCTTGNSVEISGDATSSTTCAAGVFNFTVTQSTGGTYNFSILQKSQTNISSGTATLQWILDMTAPVALTITSPATNPFYSNGSSLAISGACETGATVNLTGDSSGTTTCAAGAYSLNVSKTSDGSYTFILSQTDVAGNTSSTISTHWMRDTIAPNAVTITSPSSNPFASGDTNLTISGTCEASSTTIDMSGDSTGTTSCSALGQFSFSVNKSVDGTYNFGFIQTDRAANASASFNFQWIRDTSIPNTPVIIAPATNPIRTNTNTLTITANCDDSLTPADAIVALGGDVVSGDVTSPAGSLTQNCTTSPVTFVVQKLVDGTYNFSVSQENPNASTVSASASVQWIRDTTAPSAPTITSPATSPYTSPGDLTLSGACEANATVYLSGDSVQNIVCDLANSYSFLISKTVDNTYNFSVSQTDLAGNASGATTFQWVRLSSAVPPPTITSPIVSPLLNNSSSITITGGCVTGNTVTLGGDIVASDVTSPANALTQPCASNSYSFDIAKTTDGTFNFSLKQTQSTVDSSSVNQTWTRDTVAPTVTISAQPPAVNLSSSASFSFSSNEGGSVFQCKMDAASFATCTSPAAYPSLTNGSHTFSVQAVDLAGNTSAVNSVTWTQAAYNTMALYHLNNSAPTTDSGNYTQLAGFTNTLTATGSPANDTSGKYPTGSPSSRSFGSNISYSATSNDSLNLGLQKMTIEGFVKFTTAISTTGNYYTLVSKTGTASPQFGWELRLKKSTASKYSLDFVGSLNGTTAGTVVSSNNFSASANTWYYFAVTWNLGTVTYYFGATAATARGSKVIGTAGSSVLASTTAPVRLAANGTTGTGSSLALAGSLDEVRISQVVRTVAFPSTEFSPD